MAQISFSQYGNVRSHFAVGDSIGPTANYTDIWPWEIQSLWASIFGAVNKLNSKLRYKRLL